MNRNTNITKAFNPSSEMAHLLFLQRESNKTHLNFEKELSFYNAVKNGDINEVKKLMLPLKNENLGVLSDNPVNNIKYHLIITITMITRFCIEEGMQQEDAYTLSDVYIRKLDKCTKEEEITSLHKDAVLDYTNRMKYIRKQNTISLPVLKALDYIHNHIHEKITLEDIADDVNLNKTYLCGLFKKETGLSLMKACMKKKIEAAKDMLMYSDYSSIDISNYLSFSSHSHFISSFKAETGLTPNQFKRQYYRTHFKANIDK